MEVDPPANGRKLKKDYLARTDFIDVNQLTFDPQPKELPKSYAFNIGCVDWQLKMWLAEKATPNQHLVVELEKVDKDKLTKVLISGVVTLEKYPEKVSSNDSIESAYSEKMIYQFNSELPRYTFKMHPPIPLSNQGMAESHYLKNGRLKLTILLKVNNVRKSFFPCINFYSKHELFGRSSDVVINVRGKKFHAHRELLSTYSAFFAGMFTSDFSERDKNEVKVEQEPSVFYEFLSIIYPTGHCIKLSKIDKLLAFADQILCPHITAICQQRLLDKDSRSIPAEHKLVIAERHGLVELKARIMQTLTLDSLKKMSEITGLGGSNDGHTLEMITRRLKSALESEQKKNPPKEGEDGARKEKRSKKERLHYVRSGEGRARHGQPSAGRRRR